MVYLVLDMEIVSSEVNMGGSKYFLVDAQVVRVSDFEKMIQFSPPEPIWPSFEPRGIMLFVTTYMELTIMMVSYRSTRV